MTEATPSNWYLRQGGILRQASWAVTDAAPFHLANAYAKTWRAEDLTPEESAALAAATAPPLTGPAATIGEEAADLALGVIAHHRPDILERLDALGDELAEFLAGHPAASGLGGVRAWSALQDYAGRALGVTMREAGLCVDLAELVEDGRVTEAEAAAQRERDAIQEAAADAWAASPEGQAAAAWLQRPDDGPEGWSTVPPADPEHPMHPSKRGAA